MTEQNPIRLEYKPVKDETIKYNLQLKSEQEIREKQRNNSFALFIEMIIAMTVTEIIDEDHFRVEYIVEYGIMDRGGMELPLPIVGKSFTIDMKKSGEVTGSSFNIPFSQPAFPDNDILPGATWTRSGELMIPFQANIPQATPGGKIALPYEYTLLEIIEMDNLDCAVIEIISPETRITIEPGIESIMSAGGKVYFAWKEGRILSFRNETANTIRTADAEIECTTRSTMEMA